MLKKGLIISHLLFDDENLRQWQWFKANVINDKMGIDKIQHFIKNSGLNYDAKLNDNYRNVFDKSGWLYLSKV